MLPKKNTASAYPLGVKNKDKVKDKDKQNKSKKSLKNELPTMSQGTAFFGDGGG